MIHFLLPTGYTSCGLRVVLTGTTTDHFKVTCPACISRME